MENLTKSSDQVSIESYFLSIIGLHKEGLSFPINLENVWGLVYADKGKAVRALKETFYEDTDYQVITLIGNNPNGGRPSIEYWISVSCLEYLVARKERNVFEVYRKVFHTKINTISQNSEIQEKLRQTELLLQSVQLSVSNTKAIESHEERLKTIETKQSIEIKQDYFTILAFCKRNHIQLTFSEAIQKGKIATKLSKEKGFDLRQVSDEKYGYVNSYKEEILKQTFQL